MDSYQELCYEVGLDLEPNKYAKLRKQAMLAQEEQNDPMPWPLLFIDEMCLKMKEKLRRGKKEELPDPRPPRKMIRQIEDLDNITKANGTSHEPDPYAIASAPDNHSPNRNGSVMPSTATGPSVRPPCSNLPTKLYGVFSYPGGNPLNYGDYEVEVEGLPFDNRRRNIMRNTVFMVNMCFSGEYFEGDLKQALINGIDELAIVKKWRKGATTEMKWKKMIEYIALSHFPHIKKGQLRLSDDEFKRQIGRQRIALNPTVKQEALFEWMVDFAFRYKISLIQQKNWNALFNGLKTIVPTKTIVCNCFDSSDLAMCPCWSLPVRSARRYPSMSGRGLLFILNLSSRR